VVVPIPRKYLGGNITASGNEDAYDVVLQDVDNRNASEKEDGDDVVLQDFDNASASEKEDA
jgi:hypothetical protein